MCAFICRAGFIFAGAAHRGAPYNAIPYAGSPPTPGCTVRAGNTVRGGSGRFWEGLRNFGKIWEKNHCRLYSPPTPGCAVRAGNTVCGRLMPPNAVGGLHAGYCLPGKSINRLSAGYTLGTACMGSASTGCWRAKPASQTFPKPLKSSQSIARHTGVRITIPYRMPCAPPVGRRLCPCRLLRAFKFPAQKKGTVDFFQQFLEISW